MTMNVRFDMAITTPLLPVDKQFYRVLHDLELVTLHRSDALWRTNLPEVFPLDPVDKTDFIESWQRRSIEMNPGMTGDHWRSLYAYNRAFMNGTGFNGPEAVADFVNERDLTSPLPAWDKVRVCGGALLAGSEGGGNLIVETMDGIAHAPPLEWIFARPWLYFDALSVTTDGTLSRFPQNGGLRVRVPLVASAVVTIPLWHLQKLAPGSALPDPYKLYYQ